MERKGDLMQIEEIFTEIDSLVSKYYEKARLAREVAKKAHKRGDIRKRDKFHAVARVYEMVFIDIGPLSSELLEYTSVEFQDNRSVPF